MMNKIIYTFFLCITTSFQCSGQEIVTEKAFGGYKFYQNGKELDLNTISDIMQSNMESIQLINSSRSKNTLAKITGFAGGFLIGWPIGTALGGGEPNWTLAGAGAGLVALSIPLSWSSNKKLVEAVNLYNSGLTSNAESLSLNFKIVVNGNGIGLAMNF